MITVVPNTILEDPKLTLRQIRVLLALYRFRNPKSTNVVWPGRESLAKITGYKVERISAVTRELEALGWLTKAGKGGNGRTTRYTLRETVPDTVTVTKTGTVPDLDGNGTQNGNGYGTQNGNTIIPVNRPEETSCAKPRKRNALLDALAVIESGTTEGVTPSAWKKHGKALQEIKAATPEVTVEEIRRRAGNWRKHYKDCSLTSMALAKHWATMDKKPVSGAQIDRARQEWNPEKFPQQEAAQ